MKTRKVNTRFMDGNIDVEGAIFDALLDKYSREEVFASMLCDDNIIYSDGFVSAIERGLVPCLDRIQEAFDSKIDEEYHHFIIEDKCYVIYFK